jgi:hypothetical protein
MDNNRMYQEEIDAINRGMPHVYLKGPGFVILCKKCKTTYDFTYITENNHGIPFWLLRGFCWGFAEEHADCEEVGE